MKTNILNSIKQHGLKQSDYEQVLSIFTDKDRGFKIGYICTDNHYVTASPSSEFTPENLRANSDLNFHTLDIQRKLAILPRYIAETSPQYRHYIPYCLVVSKKDRKILAYQRSNGNEQRLNGKWSLGIGGHLNLSHISFIGSFIDIMGSCYNCLVEEFEEELSTNKGPFELKPDNLHYMGEIILTKTPVDSVHIGVVFVLVLDSFDDEPTIIDGGKETSYLDLHVDERSGFATISGDIKLEPWSEAICDNAKFQVLLNGLL